MATKRTPSRRKPAAKDSDHYRVVKRLCAIKETPIATDQILALASGNVVSSTDVMLKALELADALEHEAKQVGTVRQRLVDLPAAPQPRRSPCGLL